jgi:hypothetical protein
VSSPLCGTSLETRIARSSSWSACASSPRTPVVAALGPGRTTRPAETATTSVTCTAATFTVRRGRRVRGRDRHPSGDVVDEEEVDGRDDLAAFVAREVGDARRRRDDGERGGRDLEPSPSPSQQRGVGGRTAPATVSTGNGHLEPGEPPQRVAGGAQRLELVEAALAAGEVAGHLERALVVELVVEEGGDAVAADVPFSHGAPPPRGPCAAPCDRGGSGNARSRSASPATRRSPRR